jgi:hypothetical protein
MDKIAAAWKQQMRSVCSATGATTTARTARLKDPEYGDDVHVRKLIDPLCAVKSIA